ncbi:alpha-amylase family glycosyl hydrolase [Mangrovibacillus cuniculi]|uniref:Glycoside hydrolase family 13 protein n=1 Tax=Mangrovibacillus cuniculi TaxID=2593652 RepID=A0A7S8HGK8_9BACI|nr:alpha-amylase family glycosyl hydrolase [Mangrovibacillus cuniculi]QPC47540.1 glycoside hydrolase family 13 protein [Mangrovibacillus cuniculi]
MKRFSAIFLSLLLIISMFSPAGLSTVAEANTFDTVVLRGSEAPLDWSSNNNPLSYDEESGTWKSQPIPLTGGKKVEFKYVMDGNWMEGNNLVFTADRDGSYVFTFYPTDLRKVDVSIADQFDGELTLSVTVPESTPEWATITVATNLNAYQYNLTALEKTQKENTWELKITGKKGETLTYQYGLGADRYKETLTERRTATFGDAGTVVADTITAWDALPIAESVTHNFNHDPYIPSSNDIVTITTTVEHYGPIDAGAIYFTTDGTAPAGKRGEASNGLKAGLTVSKTEKNQSGLNISTLTGTIPEQAEKTRVKYKLDVWNTNGEGSQFADSGSFDAEDATEFAYYVDQYQSPQWAKDATIYHIFVDRFRDGDTSNNYPVNPNLPYEEKLKDWMGGDLAGVTEKLDYLDELGVNTLWISPVFEGPYSHGYHPTDFKEVSPYFGDKEVLEDLLEKAHAKGMKVVYDFVPNHTSSKHEFFQDAVERGPESPYYNWYSFTEWPNKYETFYGIAELPQFNNDNYEARDYMLNDVVPYWLTDLGFDGFRLDYAKGPSYSFWVDFRHKVKSINSDAFIFGEIWDSREKINSYAGKLDGALDFGMSDALVNVFAKGGSMTELSKTINDNLATYPEEFVMASFLDSHDEPRFLFEAGGDVDKLALAAATQYTLPGAPIVYYGTEVGLSQSGDHNAVTDWKDRYYREPMPWKEEDQNLEIKELYKNLIELRNNEEALRTGDYEEVAVSSDLFVYERSTDEDTFLVVLNKGARKQVSLNTLYNDNSLEDVSLTDVLNGDKETKSKNGKLSFFIDGEDFKVFRVTGELEEQAPDAEKKYGEVIIRGSAPFAWEGEKDKLSYNSSAKVWRSQPIALKAGEKVEFKYVMDGNWLDGNNLTFTAEKSGAHVFVFNTSDPYKVDVQPVKDAVQGGVFKDLKEGAFGQKEITKLVEDGLIVGTSATTFDPNEPISRIHAGLILLRALDRVEDDAKSIADFYDVSNVYKYINEVNLLKEDGIFSGDDNNNFRPNAPITRGETAAVLVRSLDLNRYKEISFPDAVGSIFENDIKKLSYYNITSGQADGNFGVGRYITRREFALMVYRALY